MSNADTAVDLFALLAAPVTAEVATAIAAYDAETARIAHVAARKQGKTADACGKCRGTGHLECFRHVSGGDCFDCAGTGKRGGHL